MGCLDVSCVKFLNYSVWCFGLDRPIIVIIITVWETLHRPCRLCRFSKNARFVGRLGSAPRLMADRADVVFTHTILLIVILRAVPLSFAYISWSRFTRVVYMKFNVLSKEEMSNAVFLFHKHVKLNHSCSALSPSLGGYRHLCVQSGSCMLMHTEIRISINFAWTLALLCASAASAAAKTTRLHCNLH